MSFDSQFEAQFSQLSNSQQQSSQSHNNRSSHFPFHSLSTVNHNSRLPYNNTNNQSSSQKSSSSQQSSSQQSSSLFPRRNVANLSELFSMDPTRAMTSSSNNMGYNNNNRSSQSSQSSPLLSSRVPHASSSPSSFHSFLKQTKLYQNSQNNSSSQQQTLSSQLNHNNNNHHVHRTSNTINNSNSSQKSIENQQEEMKNKQLIVFKLEHFEKVLNSIVTQQTSSNEQLSEIKVEMVNQFEQTRSILQDQSLLIQSLSEQLNQLSSLLNTTIQQLEKQQRDEKEAKEQQKEVEAKRIRSREEETNMIEQWKMSVESCQKNWMESIQVQVTKLDQMIQMSQCHAIQSFTVAPCPKDSSSENHHCTNNNHCDSSTTPSETPRVNQEIESAIVVVIDDDDENEELKTTLSDSCSDGASHSDEETSVTNHLERYLQKQIDSQWNNSSLVSTDDCCSSFTLDGSDNDLWTTDIEEEEVKRAKKRSHLLMDDGIRESQHGWKGTSSGGRMTSDHVVEYEPIFSMNRRKKYRLF